MSGERYTAVASGDRVRSERERETPDLGRTSRSTHGTGDEGAESLMERWRDSPHCTEHERKERWPVG